MNANTTTPSTSRGIQGIEISKGSKACGVGAGSDVVPTSMSWPSSPRQSGKMAAGQRGKSGCISSPSLNIHSGLGFALGFCQPQGQFPLVGQFSAAFFLGFKVFVFAQLIRIIEGLHLGQQHL